MNADKLKSKIDLKNLDASQLTEALSEHQNSLIKLVLIGAALAVVGMVFNDHQSKEKAIRAQTTAVQQKLDVIKSRDVSMKDLDHFRSSISKKLNQFQLITIISDYSKLYRVSISSFSPAESKNMGLFDVINIKFSIVSDSYKDMMLFLRKIEKSQLPIRINSWIGHEEDSGKMTFEIKISAVLIHP